MLLLKINRNNLIKFIFLNQTNYFDINFGYIILNYASGKYNILFNTFYTFM